MVVDIQEYLNACSCSSEFLENEERVSQFNKISLNALNYFISLVDLKSLYNEPKEWYRFCLRIIPIKHSEFELWIKSLIFTSKNSTADLLYNKIFINHIIPHLEELGIPVSITFDIDGFSHYKINFESELIISPYSKNEHLEYLFKSLKRTYSPELNSGNLTQLFYNCLKEILEESKKNSDFEIYYEETTIYRLYTKFIISPESN